MADDVTVIEISDFRTASEATGGFPVRRQTPQGRDQ